MNVIDIQQICVKIDGQSLLYDIDLQAEAGSFVGLIGPNGSGKSTLLRTAAGFIKPHQGRIYVRSKSITEHSRKELARIVGYVPQDTAVDFDFAAKDIVLMGRHAYVSRFREESRSDLEAAERAMKLTATLHLADRPVTRLSGGQRQMIFIAKALAQNPHLLLLDEPISALDIRYQLHVLALLRKLADEGMTVIAALHDLNLSARYCDKLVLLTEGEIMHAGSPSEVLTPLKLRLAYGVRARVQPDPWFGWPTVTAVGNAPGSPGNPFDPYPQEMEETTQ
ncbi:MAG: iron-dicitrate transporter ATP-binding protein [Paenibacillus sp.]|jgi:iron complex transport system ATP-binding protein|nr:iron-dicitrate transporter ATP-binding protein [Paenibacillus sp.]